MAITKVTGHVIEPTTNIQAGIITATRFDGPIGVGLTDGNFSGIITTTQLNVTGVGTFKDDVYFNGTGAGISSAFWDKSANEFKFKDNVKLSFGDSQDLHIEHIGTKSYIKDTGTGSLRICSNDFRVYNAADDEYMIRALQDTGVSLYDGANTVRLATNGSGAVVTGICTATDFSGAAGGAADFPNGLTGTTATFSGNVTIGGTLTYEDVTNIDSVGVITARDNVHIAEWIAHIGDLNTTIGFPANDTITFNTASSERLRITSAGLVGIGTDTPSGNLHVQTTGGTYDPLVIERKGSSNWGIKPYANALYFRANSDGSNSFNSRDRFAISWDGTDARGGDVNFYGTAAGVTSCTWDASENHLIFKDNSKIRLGNDSDGELWSSGSHVYLRAMITGQTLRLTGDDVYIRNRPDGQSMARFDADGGVDLFYNTAPKFETTNTGITVTGEVAASQDYPVIKPTLDLNFAATKTLDPRFEYYRYGPASYVDANGNIVLVGEDVPRFDHDPVTRECKGLLIEGERRNVLPYSFDAGKWVAGSNGTLTRDAGIAPDGTMTATKAAIASNDIDTSPKVSGIDGSGGNITVSASVTYTLSVWVKASTTAQIGNNFKVRMKRVSGTSFAPETTFALTGNWARYSVTGTTPANVTQVMCYVGGVSGSEALVWGAQLESGTTPSSLIPTYGYTQARGEDILQITGEEFSDFYNQEEGSIILSASYETDARNVANVTFDDTSNESEYTDVGYRAGGAGSNQVAVYIRTDSGNDQYFKNWTSAATQGNEFKVALAYKDNNYASSANGEAVHTDTSGTTSRLYDRLRFSDTHNVGHGGVGHYRRLMYYSKRITDSQLVTLTS